jgi:hypothetical protein
MIRRSYARYRIAAWHFQELPGWKRQDVCFQWTGRWSDAFGGPMTTKSVARSFCEVIRKMRDARRGHKHGTFGSF